MNVWKYKLEQHSQIKDELVKSIREHGIRCAKYDGSVDSTVFTDFHSTEPCREYSEIFVPHLQGFLKEILNRTGCGSIDYFWWYARYIQNGEHSWHVHPRSHLSAVYYVRLEEPGDATEFYDPSGLTSFQPNVEEGDIIVFPSYLPHRSKFIESNREKIIISMNFNLGIDTDPTIMRNK
ncbi:2OG-Fe(II) oxygenase superfamily domain containing protein [Synechococcus phage S-CAM9]|uniref:2OG-Fe(II) oxygenase superfamily domain containing protein n=1 Tax=Synechococcus phage S-CAM9 TaxID=1883369 RepID=A0A1D8KNV7_9CAUD|nr:2OG-Fe(II) oxygenase [Synechococcus phage S-CAM9]AOV60356.1 2OG-Fe(II) oxygenase superfamily domain containing protein [Synechococcus phage S-CAM9]AOV60584.1 2OG-Fe(II) oxygenase superfamily domain containing protein [Synechococcus phage S-CAM9]AOV60813.1 2OG-Fe(II) oxygenase superfamily domain containing protein [Synechococcus phage S-CAM9]